MRGGGFTLPATAQPEPCGVKFSEACPTPYGTSARPHKAACRPEGEVPCKNGPACLPRRHAGPSDCRHSRQSLRDTKRMSERTSLCSKRAMLIMPVGRSHSQFARPALLFTGVPWLGAVTQITDLDGDASHCSVVSPLPHKIPLCSILRRPCERLRCAIAY